MINFLETPFFELHIFKMSFDVVWFLAGQFNRNPES